MDCARDSVTVRETCETVGFDVSEVTKLTTGPRAMMFLVELYRERFGNLPDEPFGRSVLTVLQTIHTQQAGFHQWCDGVYPNNRVISSKEHQHAFFIALMLVAEKPTAPEKSVTRFDFSPDRKF